MRGYSGVGRPRYGYGYGPGIGVGPGYYGYGGPGYYGYGDPDWSGVGTRPADGWPAYGNGYGAAGRSGVRRIVTNGPSVITIRPR